jgi:probable F420-dependent oxidoreductase
MRVGIHLPQYGRAASPSSIREAAARAEELGFDDVWVSDHLAIPDGAPYPPPYLYDALITLTWAAAVTRTVGLGTSVLVMPYRHPVQIAKELATLDLFSEGRLILGAAAGWLREEFETLNVPYVERGRRTDDAINALRACWEQRIVDFRSKTVVLKGMRVEPRPARRIPIWVGGTSAAARHRAAAIGDGWHAIGLEPDVLQPMVAEMRESRPEPEFTISLRVTWDGLNDDPKELTERLAALVDLGIGHVLVVPSQSDPIRWNRSVERLADALVARHKTVHQDD